MLSKPIQTVAAFIILATLGGVIASCQTVQKKSGNERLPASQRAELLNQERERMNLYPQLVISDVLSTLLQAGLADRETIHDNLKVHQERTSQFIAICNSQTMLEEHKKLFLRGFIQESRASLQLQSRYLPDFLVKDFTQSLGKLDAFVDQGQLDDAHKEALTIQKRLSELERRMEG